VKSQENYGHSAADTKGALAALTLATQDPKKALEDMTVVANLAAQKHESLTEAAGQVAKVYGGAGKVLKQYGITLDSTTKQAAALKTAETQHQAAITTLATAQKKLSDLEAIDSTKKKLSTADELKLRDARNAVTVASDNLKAKTEKLTVAQAGSKTATQNADVALGQLGKRLDGQASASVDNWAGKLKVARTKLSDWTAEFGQKFGPALTATGPVLMAAGMALDLYRGHAEKVKEAAQAVADQERATAAATATSATDQEVSLGATAAAAETASATAITADDEASASTANLAMNVQDSAGQQLTAFDLVGAGAQAASQTAIDADDAAEASTTNLALSVTASKDAQVIAFRETAAAAVSASEVETGAAREAGAASSLSLGPIGIAVGVIGGGLLLAAQHFHLFGDGAKNQIQPVADLTAAIMADSDAMKTNTRTAISKHLSDTDAYNDALVLGVGQTKLTDAFQTGGAALEDVRQRVNAAITAYDNATKTTRTWDSATNSWVTSTGHATTAQKNANTAALALARSLPTLQGQLSLSKTQADNMTKGVGASATQVATLASNIKKIPQLKGTKVTVDDYDAVSKIADYYKTINAIPHYYQTMLQLNVQTSSNKKAAGSAFAAGGMPDDGVFTVGEEGTEIMEKHGAYLKVISSPQAHHVLAGGGAGSGSGGNATSGDVAHFTIIHQLDAHTVHKSLLTLKRQQGGRLELIDG
ncbi:MAG TPA: hypothetical protein VGH54_25915, partial [Mycobacterium sp.]|uniref:hypothetical protein n=1 Tax=Mycobacterium sp. TaxID=1785 RepID=UPI002F3E55C3